MATERLLLASVAESHAAVTRALEQRGDILRAMSRPEDLLGVAASDIGPALPAPLTSPNSGPSPELRPQDATRPLPSPTAGRA